MEQVRDAVFIRIEGLEIVNVGLVLNGDQSRVRSNHWRIVDDFRADADAECLRGFSAFSIDNFDGDGMSSCSGLFKSWCRMKRNWYGHCGKVNSINTIKRYKNFSK